MGSLAHVTIRAMAAVGLVLGLAGVALADKQVRDKELVAEPVLYGCGYYDNLHGYGFYQVDLNQGTHRYLSPFNSGSVIYSPQRGLFYGLSSYGNGDSYLDWFDPHTGAMGGAAHIEILLGVDGLAYDQHHDRFYTVLRSIDPSGNNGVVYSLQQLDPSTGRVSFLAWLPGLPTGLTCDRHGILWFLSTDENQSTSLVTMNPATGAILRQIPGVQKYISLAFHPMTGDLYALSFPQDGFIILSILSTVTGQPTSSPGLVHLSNVVFAPMFP